MSRGASGVNVWEAWYESAVAQGVRADLAELGRSVIRDYWEHGKHSDELAGDGPFLGADRHHQMMIAIAVQKPELAKALFKAELGNESPQEDELRQAVSDAEETYSVPNVVWRSPEWFGSVYALDGCIWDLYSENDHQWLRNQKMKS